LRTLTATDYTAGAGTTGGERSRVSNAAPVTNCDGPTLVDTVDDGGFTKVLVERDQHAALAENAGHGLLVPEVRGHSPDPATAWPAPRSLPTAPPQMQESSRTFTGIAAGKPAPLGVGRNGDDERVRGRL